MNVNTALAENIVEEVKRVIKEDVIFIDDTSTIIASTDPSRKGTLHEGAQLVLRTKQKLYIDDSNLGTLKGVKQGITMPLINHGSVVGIIGITGAPEKVEAFAELTRRLTELMIHEAFLLEEQKWQDRSIEVFFNEWIRSENVDQELMNQGMRLGIPLDRPYLCCLVEAKSPKSQPAQAERYTRSAFHSCFPRKQNFFVRWGEDLFLLMIEVSGLRQQKDLSNKLESCRKEMEKHYDGMVRIGIGSSQDNIVMEEAYKNAKKALQAATEDKRLIFYEELSIELVLSDVSGEAKSTFLTRVIEPLQQKRELVQTLEMYLHCNQSVKETAGIMHIHINTLHYRLKQIKECTGIDPRTTEGIVAFYLALEFLK